MRYNSIAMTMQKAKYRKPSLYNFVKKGLISIPCKFVFKFNELSWECDVYENFMTSTVDKEVKRYRFGGFKDWVGDIFNSCSINRRMSHPMIWQYVYYENDTLSEISRKYKQLKKKEFNNKNISDSEECKSEDGSKKRKAESQESEESKICNNNEDKSTIENETDATPKRARITSQVVEYPLLRNDSGSVFLFTRIVDKEEIEFKRYIRDVFQKNNNSLKYPVKNNNFVFNFVSY